MASSNWWQDTPSSPYGAYAGRWGNYTDYEKGNVYSYPAGTALGLPAAATYDPRYSTQYNAVYDLPNGLALSFMHIKNLLYGVTKPTPEPAGFQFATDPNLPSNYTGQTVTGLSHFFVESDRPGTGVVEMGVYNTPAQAFMRDNGGDIAPSQWPSILSGSGSTIAGTTGPADSPTVGGSRTITGTYGAADSVPSNRGAINQYNQQQTNGQQPGDQVINGPMGTSWDVSQTERNVGHAILPWLLVAGLAIAGMVALLLALKPSNATLLSLAAVTA